MLNHEPDDLLDDELVFGQVDKSPDMNKPARALLKLRKIGITSGEACWHGGKLLAFAIHEARQLKKIPAKQRTPEQRRRIAECDRFPSVLLDALVNYPSEERVRAFLAIQPENIAEWQRKIEAELKTARKSPNSK